MIVGYLQNCNYSIQMNDVDGGEIQEWYTITTSALIIDIYVYQLMFV